MKQMIKCPLCGKVQEATVDTTTAPFNTYVHECEVCEFVITESDWQKEKTE